jgi:hypothetical protein
MSQISDADWGKIHAKAWRDPEFRRLLETDPTQAIHSYAKEAKIALTKDTKLVTLREKPADIPDQYLDKVHQSVPWCC